MQYEDILIKSCHFELIEVITKILEENDDEILKARDKEGNTCLIISAIKSNLRMAKLFINYPSLLDAKNNYGIDAITISIHNNDNLIFFLLANNLNTSVQNISYLCKIAIRMQNYDILEYLIRQQQKEVFIYNYIYIYIYIYFFYFYFYKISVI
jgi:ankyrin repeat protein